jgi:hypothetical protein
MPDRHNEIHTGRISGRVGCSRRHRFDPDHAGSGEISCAGIDGRRVAPSQSGKTSTPTSSS